MRARMLGRRRVRWSINLTLFLEEENDTVRTNMYDATFHVDSSVRFYQTIFQETIMNLEEEVEKAKREIAKIQKLIDDIDEELKKKKPFSRFLKEKE